MALEEKTLETWSTKKSLSLYSVKEWSKGYFSINDAGNLCVTPRGDNGPKLDLKQLVDDLRERGLRLPLWIRFPDIVASRIRELNECFQRAFSDYNYQGKYRGVYPIKVNQQRSLVEDIVRFGLETNLGLEAGSKPELLIALALQENPNALLICNGFKDRPYIETALLATRLGRNVIVVIDRFEELGLLIQQCKKLDIRPNIGFRAKLESKGAGKWVESSGARSKFGLTATEIVNGIEILRNEGMLDCLCLLHFHLGSQISSIRPIKDSLSEAVRLFAEICDMGAKLRYLDVGGGLGVDYDGSKTNSENSVNYSEQEYANDVVSSMQSVCDERGLQHPDIITEAGRALVAHHCVMVYNVLGQNEIMKYGAPDVPEENDHQLVHDMYQDWLELNSKNMLEAYHDTLQAKDEAINLFKLGYLNLRSRAKLESLFWHTISKIRRTAAGMPASAVPEEIQNLDQMVQDSYFCNFSIFQSAPDHWAVKQLFPVMPVHRLNEQPTKQVTLMDLTCDSDGKMDRFIDIKDVKRALDVHTLREGEEYFLGMFMLGAYQEILGDLHNLFGDTDAVHVSIKDNEEYEIDHYVEGDSVKQVLGYVQYNKSNLMERMRVAVEAALKEKRMSIQEGRELLGHYEESLNGYTYLDSEDLIRRTYTERSFSLIPPVNALK